MDDLNTARITGRLTRDPKYGTTKSGSPWARFSVAINSTRQGRDGQAVQEADYINVSAWGPIAEAIEGSGLIKGDKVMVEGKITSGSYEKNGTKVYTTEITARIVTVPMSAPKGEPQKKGDFSQFGQPVPQAPQAPAYSQGNLGETPPAPMYSRDEELPF